VLILSKRYRCRDEMVIIMLMRHGKAEPLSRFPNDTERPLTDEGRREVECISNCIERPSIILTSPLLRALQTAEILSKRFSVKFEVNELLRPENFNEENLIRLIRPGALLIGHNPSLEETLMKMSIRVSLSPASVAALNVVQRKLLWLCTPQNCSRVCLSLD